jgi:hypothetical protein
MAFNFGGFFTMCFESHCASFHNDASLALKKLWTGNE